MSDTESESVERGLKTIQTMIDNFETHLIRLRTQCELKNENTQNEIRDTESKLLKYFSSQIVTKNRLSSESLQDRLSEYPSTNKWLSIVGLPKEAKEGILASNINLYTLLEMSEDDIKSLLNKYNTTAEDKRRLNVALKNLRTSIEYELKGKNNSMDGIELHWTSLKGNALYGDMPAKIAPRPSTSSIPSSTDTQPIQSSQNTTHSTPPSPVAHSHNYSRYTPPPTPPTVRPTKTKYPITPPPKKKNLLFPEYPLSRSKSQESHLAHRVQDIDPVKNSRKTNRVKDLNLGGSYVNLGGSHDILTGRRWSNESETGGSSRGPSGPASPIITSPIHSPPYMQGTGDNTLIVPMAHTATMMHQIKHKYVSKIFIASNCDICHKNVFRGKFCKYCKFKCHKDCTSKAPPSCCLPEEYVDAYMNSYSLFDGSPNQARRVTNPTPGLPSNTPEAIRTTRSVPAFQVPDSSSTSSCNSSTHSSPVPMGMSSGTVTSPSPAPSPNTQVPKFLYPDLSESSSDMTQTEPLAASTWDADLDVVSTNTSNDSDKTLVDSNTSERTVLDRNDSVESQDEAGHNWYRNNSLSIALKEWDIPYEELSQEDVIGTGRFGTVYKGLWHGDVAIKMLNMDPDSDNAAQLSAFKLEVAMLRKTRHENLVLFMGACMKPPHLAIVTSLCRGKSLYTLIHVRKEKFPMSKTIIIAQQVSQGMGYLHAKGIIHKDLKTKNIFFDKDKVVITDFGLFNVTKLCHENRHTDRLEIPPGWLCYLSPEIIRSLQAGSAYAKTDLPFSEMSDVYAFGSVWFELTCGEWPFRSQPPESIIWQVGRGIKQSLGSIKGSKEVKDVLIMCWAFSAEDRPSFRSLLKVMGKLPRKPFQRSPSHPIHLTLSRSADSLFTS